jgi:hypothetical protein
MVLWHVTMSVDGFIAGPGHDMRGQQARGRRRAADGDGARRLLLRAHDGLRARVAGRRDGVLPRVAAALSYRTKSRTCA